jgi:fructose-1,6-bisphosphatase class II
MDRNLALEFVRVTEAAAISASAWTGKGDEHAADHAAVTAMRDRMASLEFDGTIVIGEGERDEAPMLYIGEKVGDGKGPKIDIAVDPLEGTTITSKGGPNALAVLAAAPTGCLLHAPDTYMDKIAVGPKAAGKVSLEYPVSENLRIVGECVGKKIPELSVVVMDRPRHENLIKEIRSLGARIMLIGDGDVSGAISTAIPDSGADLLLGIGGAPEGVLAAAALSCLGGQIEGRLAFRNEGVRKRAFDYGIKNPDGVLKMQDLVKGEEAVFSATGVTNGTMLSGVKYLSGGAISTHSVVMRAKSGTVRFITTIHANKSGSAKSLNND